jgi:uncharacterized protein YaiL (DUF2058 family)
MEIVNQVMLEWHVPLARHAESCNVKVSSMANSFGDQFLKAGLVSKTRLNKANKSKHRQQKLKNKQKVEVVDEAAVAARQAAAEQAARDRELNRRQKQELEQRAVQAQIRQLVELNRLPRDDGEIGYNFQDGTAIRKIFVTDIMHEKLTRGLLAIVSHDDGYEVIPSVVAEKIKLRDESCIISHAAGQPEDSDDDAYADYKVPDDLMW